MKVRARAGSVAAAAVLMALAISTESNSAFAQQGSSPAPSASAPATGTISGTAATAPAAANAPVDAKASAEAQARFKRGLEMYQEGDSAGALAEFRKAYDLSGNSRLLYNIGQVCAQTQDHLCALRAFQKYLSDTPDVAPKRRSDVNEDIAKLQRRVGTVSASTNIEGVDLLIDDLPAGRTPQPPIQVNVGRHTVTGYKDGYIRVVRVVDVAGGDAVHIDMSLQRITPEGSGDPLRVNPIEGQPVRDNSGSSMTTLSWVGVGLTGAFVAGATVTGVIAATTSHDLNSRPFENEVPASAKSDQTKIKTFALTADILGAAAVITLATTLVFTFLVKPSKGGAKAGVGSLVLGQPRAASSGIGSVPLLRF